MGVNQKIQSFGNKLKGRLDASLADFDLEYINHSENILAFETLCDHIADYGVEITKDEYNQVIEIVNELNLELDERYLYIKPEKSS
ncbi:MafI family immunity protein [Proteus vulgaris]|uniref:MafI family immunity protein n=1 Tax=Proteus vulgaris TaxID=585 RepID=UPI0018E4957E|nr:MafI family immunity protein [Proteus vulgaris]MBI6530397.1 MafI family immunity protein [Proteus vulgaris]